ncbi:replication-relaxation family protein [Priestia sp. JV24]|uniref:replication-relaxation family protein n=1 Tax=Priestia TaxID=2800373 RepID=UPI0021D65EB5|nr:MULTISPECIES: replication-relaxation family protein [Priestia]MCU7712985.1 replication-relaxation family protein [Priestia megaterium]MCW1049170.1 replication-relaxation family protein [Priestia sp. JV24]
MKSRDLEILNDLQRFRCLTRDDLIHLHFSHLKNPINSANTVLKRLRRDGYIDVNTSHNPYLYFASPAPIKKDSTKIPHFLKIVDFYKQVCAYEGPKSFIIEPKYGKGYMEPDIFMIFKRAPFFVEIQRSVYSQKVMNEKIKRYETYYMGQEWQKEPWQPKDRKVFPRILMVSDTRYNIDSPYIKVFQIQNIDDFIEQVTPRIPADETIRINQGNIRLK